MFCAKTCEGGCFVPAYILESDYRPRFVVDPLAERFHMAVAN